MPEAMNADQLATESVYYALFRMVQVGELENADSAIEWAERALASEELRRGIVDGVKDRLVERELASSARFARNS